MALVIVDQGKSTLNLPFIINIWNEFIVFNGILVTAMCPKIPIYIVIVWINFFLVLAGKCCMLQLNRASLNWILSVFICTNIHKIFPYFNLFYSFIWKLKISPNLENCLITLKVSIDSIFFLPICRHAEHIWTSSSSQGWNIISETFSAVANFFHIWMFMHWLIIFNFKWMNAIFKINRFIFQIQIFHLFCNFVNINEA